MSSDLLHRTRKLGGELRGERKGGEIEPLYIYLSRRSVVFLFPPFIWKLSFPGIHRWKMASILRMIDAKCPSIDMPIDRPV